MSSYGKSTFYVQLGVEVGLGDSEEGHHVEVHLDGVGNTLRSWDE